jgi:hypothetical protein
MHLVFSYVQEPIQFVHHMELPCEKVIQCSLLFTLLSSPCNSLENPQKLVCAWQHLHTCTRRAHSLLIKSWRTIAVMKYIYIKKNTSRVESAGVSAPDALNAGVRFWN